MLELHPSRDNKAKFYSHEGCYKVVDLCKTKKKLWTFPVLYRFPVVLYSLEQNELFYKNFEQSVILFTIMVKNKGRLLSFYIRGMLHEG